MSKHLDRLAARVEKLRDELHQAEIDHRLREIAECEPHDWRDESYENGHNGNWETVFKCRDCGHTVFEDPRAKA